MCKRVAIIVGLDVSWWLKVDGTREGELCVLCPVKLPDSYARTEHSESQ